MPDPPPPPLVAEQPGSLGRTVHGARRGDWSVIPVAGRPAAAWAADEVHKAGEEAQVSLAHSPNHSMGAQHGR